MKHTLKNPRYKICFQTRNKVWIYKNSRLRNFYKLRNRIVLKTGFLGKEPLITKNMKWTVARRQMVPYFRKRKNFEYFYKQFFFTKQQLKNFYGGLKEYQLRNIFKKTWNKELFFRTNIFIGALEQRIGMVFFRMRLVPTIYACNQLIKHHGILVNDSLITLDNYKISLGDVVSIPAVQWEIFYEFLIDRLLFRYWGIILFYKKKKLLIKKFLKYQKSKRFGQSINFKLLKIFNTQKVYFKQVYNALAECTIEMSKKTKIFLFVQFYFLFKFFPRLLAFEKIIQKYFNKKKLHRFKLKKKNNNKKKNWNYKRNHFLLIKILFNIFYLQLSFEKFENFFFKISTFFFSKHVKKYNELFSHKLLFLKTPDIELTQKKIFEDVFKKFHIFNFKKFLTVKKKHLKYTRYIKHLIRKFKFYKRKKKMFKYWCSQPHWYIPRYLEINYKTLETIFVYYPNYNDVHYSFICSFKKIVSFYKQHAL